MTTLVFVYLLDRMLLLLFLVIIQHVCSHIIVYNKRHTFAAAELRRYLYLQEHKVPLLMTLNENLKLNLTSTSFNPKTPKQSLFLLTNLNTWHQDVLQAVPTSNTALIISHLKTLTLQLRPATEDHLISTPQSISQSFNIIVIVGADSGRSTMYGVYTLIEHITNIRFRIHGDILPDRLNSNSSSINYFTESIVATPGNVLHRGLQPFHDFSEGPDMWSTNEYKHLLSQMNKMKMNTLGLHTYGGGLAEPTVWVGEPSTFNSSTGQPFVNGSYPATYETTASGGLWGGFPMNISSYLFGGQHLFESNCWSSESMKQAGRCNSDILVPKIQHPINVWTSVANMLTEAFEWARNMEGMYTVVGVECGTGTQIPTGENLTEWYEGTLDRIQKTYNATHFWLWTNEAWTARRNDTMQVSNPSIQQCVDEFQALHRARDIINSDLELATCGWTVGPKIDRTYFDQILPKDYTLTSINERVGNVNIEKEYSTMSPDRRKWSIPWMEDDPAMSAIQLWVNRTITFSKDAVNIGGVTGLLGIHWKLAEISPQISALAKYPWSQNINLTDVDIYMDIATHEFGLSGSNAEKMTEILISIDSYFPNMPRAVGNESWPNEANLTSQEGAALQRPVVWGPGIFDCTYEYDSTNWLFKSKFDSMRSHVSGNLSIARYNIWSSYFQYMEDAALVSDTWRKIVKASVNGVLASKMKSSTVQNNSSVDIWMNRMLPLRQDLFLHSSNMMKHLIASVTDTGGMGVVVNFQQASLPLLSSTIDLMYDGYRNIKSDGKRRKCNVIPGKCYVDGGSSLLPGKKSRNLPFNTGVGLCSDSWSSQRCQKYSSMSHSFCAGLCDARNYTIGGIEGSSGSQCFCGNDINTTTAQVAPQEECANRCQGNQTEYCGGDWRLQTFTFDCKEDDDADGGDLPILPPWPQNVTWQYHQNESYTGTPRIFVLTPRDRVDEKDGNEMEVTAVVLGTTRNDDDVRSGVLLFWRRVDVDLVNEGEEEWKNVQMIRTVSERSFWKGKIGPLMNIKGALLEYYVLSNDGMRWPAGGTHSIVVSL